jgi:hypothetical protein
MNKEIMTISQGPLFPSSMRVLFGIVGIVCAVSIIGIPLALIFFGVIIYNGGTQIDMNRGQIREYGSTYGLKWGKWKSLENYTALVILRSKRVSTMYSRGSVGLDIAEVDHDVVFVDDTHRRKFLIKACPTFNEAQKLAVRLSGLTKRPVQRYSPKKISHRR